MASAASMTYVHQLLKISFCKGRRLFMGQGRIVLVRVARIFNRFSWTEILQLPARGLSGHSAAEIASGPTTQAIVRTLLLIILTLLRTKANLRNHKAKKLQHSRTTVLNSMLFWIK